MQYLHMIVTFSAFFVVISLAHLAHEHSAAKSNGSSSIEDVTATTLADSTANGRRRRDNDEPIKTQSENATADEDGAEQSEFGPDDEDRSVPTLTSLRRKKRSIIVPVTNVDGMKNVSNETTDDASKEKSFEEVTPIAEREKRESEENSTEPNSNQSNASETVTEVSISRAGPDAPQMMHPIKSTRKRRSAEDYFGENEHGRERRSGNGGHKRPNGSTRPSGGDIKTV